MNGGKTRTQGRMQGRGELAESETIAINEERGS